MNYLNEEYKKLSDWDKKDILPDIIKFLEKEKQKVDDKINGANNGKVFLKNLEIEESDIEEWKEEIESCQQSLVESKKDLDNKEITQEEYDEIKKKSLKKLKITQKS